VPSRPTTRPQSLSPRGCHHCCQDMSTHTHYMQFEQYEYIQARFKLDSEFRVQSSEFNFRVQWGHSKLDFLEFLTLRGLRTGANHPAVAYLRPCEGHAALVPADGCVSCQDEGRASRRAAPDGRVYAQGMARTSPCQHTGQWQSSRRHGKRGASPR
jgi:hypothetical protein